MTPAHNSSDCTVSAGCFILKRIQQHIINVACSLQNGECRRWGSEALKDSTYEIASRRAATVTKHRYLPPFQLHFSFIFFTTSNAVS